MRELKADTRQANSLQERNLVENIKEYPKKFYSYALKKHASSSITVLYSDNSVAATDFSTADN